MSKLNVYSEIGRLKTVLLHRPGGELENLTPKWLDSLLFDDIPWLELAQKEHDAFAKVFRDNGVEVLYLTDLVTEALETDPKIKDMFVDQYIKEAQITSDNLTEVIKEYLFSCKTTGELVQKTMAGIRKTEVPNFKAKSLTDFIKDYPFLTDPMPNLYFTRDPFSVIGNGVSISKMFTTTRSRETIYGEYIFKYHPIYGTANIPIYYDRDYKSSIEGGDILVLTDKVLAIGVSQRTHPAAIEKLAHNIFSNTCFEKIVAFDIPKIRAFMHLDTVFTQLDYDKFLMHTDINSTMRAYELSRGKNDNVSIKLIEKKIDKILEQYLGRKITLIPCGGNDVVSSDREQWNDGANTIVIAPGEVIVYERNHITNEILQKHGIKVHTIASSELSRGRGGPRCMTMPFIREDISH